MSWRDRLAIFAVIVLVVWGGNALTNRTDELADTQKTLVAQQKRIDALVRRLDVQQSGDAVRRVTSVDQRCDVTARIVQVFDRPPAPKALGAGFREDLAKCRRQRERYVNALSPSQLAEYQRQAAEDAQ